MSSDLDSCREDMGFLPNYVKLFSMWAMSSSLNRSPRSCALAWVAPQASGCSPNWVSIDCYPNSTTGRIMHFRTKDCYRLCRFHNRPVCLTEFGKKNKNWFFFLFSVVFEDKNVFELKPSARSKFSESSFLLRGCPLRILGLRDLLFSVILNDEITLYCNHSRPMQSSPCTLLLGLSDSTYSP